MVYYKPISLKSASGGNTTSVGIRVFDENRVSVVFGLRTTLQLLLSGDLIITCSIHLPQRPLK